VQTVIRTEKLTKRFGDLVAVDGLDLEVHEGEVFGFLGPNGAGKTTTLRLLCALIGATSGTADVAGFRLGRQDPQIRAAVGILTEQPGLYERQSAWDNLVFFATLYGLDRTTAARQAEHFLRLMGLWDRRVEAVATFSRGMKQKMAIARAALHEPRILFLDEPTTGLDPDAAKTVREFIVAVRGEGRTVFLCTHNLDEADRLCDRIAFFRQSVIRIDTPDHLRAELYGRATEFRLMPTPRAEDLVRVQAVEGVREAHLENGSIVVSAADPLRTNPLLVRTLVESGAQIAYVIERKVHLEDVYLSIVEGSGPPRQTRDVGQGDLT
jgi:ABC-2 type transport system ATP-binding protein